MITQEKYKPTCIYMQQINEIFLSYQNNDAIHLGGLFHILKMETTLSIHSALKNQSFYFAKLFHEKQLNVSGPEF